MKLKHLVLASILLLAGACFAQSCKLCSNNVCVDAGAGGCKCKGSSTGGCGTCGECIEGICLINCFDAPLAPETKSEIAHQTWLNSASLADDLDPYSRTMSILIRAEQKDLKEEWCMQLRRGNFGIEGGHYVNWEMFLLKDGVHYRIKETSETLDIVKDRWVFSHDDGIPAATGIVR